MSSVVALVTISIGNISRNSTATFCLGFENSSYCILIATYSSLASLTTFILFLKYLFLQVKRITFLDNLADSRKLFLLELVAVVFLFLFNGAVSIAAVLGQVGLDYCSPSVFGYNSRACETARSALVAVWVSMIFYVVLCSTLLIQLRTLKTH